MKKIFSIFIVLFALKSYSQSYYKNLFDSEYKTHLGYSDSGSQSDFSWAASAHMEALALMYEKTKDKDYAETLIKCIGNVIDRRDDLRDLLNLQQFGISNISDYRDSIGPVWSTNHYNKVPDVGKTYAHMVHSANIIYPMAKFAAIVKKDTTLNHLKYTSGGRYDDMTFKEIADNLKQRIKETLEYHKDQWHSEPSSNSNPNDSIGYYKERDSMSVDYPIKYQGSISPFNMQSSMGRVLVQMYRATDDENYLRQLNQIANFLKANTSFDAGLGVNIWEYWKETTLVLPDDLSHAGLTIAFPYECWKYQISKNGNLIYTDSDMKAYSNTFTKDIYRSPLFINKSVGQNSESWNIKNDTRTPPNSLAFDGYISYRWLCLSDYDRKIYQLVADLYAAENFYSRIHLNNLSYYSSLTLAMLVTHEKLIVPTNTDHEWDESSDWRGGTNGNFYGDSKEEFAVIRNYDGMISIMEPQGRKFYKFPNSKVYGNSYEWRGIAAGDFFGDNKSEIIALSNHSNSADNGIYVLKIENNNIVEEGKLTGFGVESDWVGVTAGKFISGGKDDFVAARNYNKEVIVYKFNGTTVEPVRSNALNLPANSKIAAIASGNLDSDDKDEIVLLINSPDAAYNGIHVYDIDDNGVMTKIAERTNWGIDSEWKGLAVGDFDGNGVDEIIAHRNFNGEYIVFKLNGNILDGFGSESFPVLQTTGNVMCLGNFDPGSKNEELVTLRKDGGIVMFSASQVVKTPPQANKQSDPCQNEVPDVLFSFLKSASYNKEDLKEIVSVK